MLGKGKQTAPQTIGVKASWACLIGTLSFCLWGANALPIQNVQYQLVANLAISEHRMPMLEKLQGKRDFSVPDTVPLSSLEILRDENRASSISNSELRSVRVKVRCPLPYDIKDIEKTLAELTVPCMETDECKVFALQLHKEKWLLESSLHSIKRLELDCEHDKLAIETNDTNDNLSEAGQETDETAPSSPFRLTSFGVNSNIPQSPSLLLENLRHLAQLRAERLDSMSQTLERLKAKSRGFLSVTGSPTIEPIVRQLTGARLFVLLILCAMVWCILMFWLNPSLSRFYSKPTARSATSTSRRVASRMPSKAAATTNFDKTIQWMRREGIPYLGEVQVLVDDSYGGENVSLTGSTAPTHSIKPQAFDEVVNDRPAGISLVSLGWLRSLSEGSLVLWIGLFAARLMFDPVWRDLVAAAPLAAISRMVSGVQ